MIFRILNARIPTGKAFWQSAIYKLEATAISSFLDIVVFREKIPNFGWKVGLRLRSALDLFLIQEKTEILVGRIA